MLKIKVLASGSSGNCYHISDGSSAILLDAGISIDNIRKGLNFKLSDVVGAFITHRHNDHSKALPDLIKTGINVYAPQDVFDYKKACSHRCRPVTDGISSGKAVSWVTAGTFRVLPFEVHHDVPTLGFYVHSVATSENLLYFTDTYYITQVFPNLHYIMAECNYSSEAVAHSIAEGRIPAAMKSRLVKSHMSLDTLLDFFKANDLSNVKQIYLLHLSDNNSRETEFKEAVQCTAGCEVYVC